MSDKQSRKTFRLRMDEMIRTIREQIVAGHYSVGDFLPSELDLSMTFQLSNNSVRKALDILVNEGMIEKIPRVGNRVITPSKEDRIVLRFGSYPSMDPQCELPYLLSEFEKKHPHIRIQRVQTTDERGYVRRLLDNDLIDVFTVNNFVYRELVEEQALDLLEPQERMEEIYPFLQRVFCHEGKQYVQPFVFSPVILCYNKGHLASGQVPEPDSSWAWDDLLEHASRLAIKNERFGLYFQLFNLNRWIIFLLQSGEAFRRDEHGRYRIQGTRLLDGIEKVRDILHTPTVYPLMLSGNADAERLFSNEQVSFIVTTYFAMNDLKKAKFEFDVAPLPHLNSNKTLNVMIGLAIHKRSKEKAAAKQLLDFLVSSEAQLLIRKKTYTIPANMQAAQWTGETEHFYPSRYQMFKEIIPSFSTFAETNLTLRQLNGILSECKLYWTGLASKEKLAANIEELLNH